MLSLLRQTSHRPLYSRMTRQALGGLSGPCPLAWNLGLQQESRRHVYHGHGKRGDNKKGGKGMRGGPRHSGSKHHSRHSVAHQLPVAASGGHTVGVAAPAITGKTIVRSSSSRKLDVTFAAFLQDVTLAKQSLETESRYNNEAKATQGEALQQASSSSNDNTDDQSIVLPVAPLAETLTPKLLTQLTAAKNLVNSDLYLRFSAHLNATVSGGSAGGTGTSGASTPGNGDIAEASVASNFNPRTIADVASAVHYFRGHQRSYSSALALVCMRLVDTLNPAAFDSREIAILLRVLIVGKNPKLHSVLFFFVRRVLELTATMPLSHLVEIINAYGRCGGFQHRDLINAFVRRLAADLEPTTLSASQLTNVVHAVGSFKCHTSQSPQHAELVSKLHASVTHQLSVRRQQFQSLMIVSILDGLSRSWRQGDDTAVFSRIEAELVKKLSDVPTSAWGDMLLAFGRIYTQPSGESSTNPTPGARMFQAVSNMVCNGTVTIASPPAITGVLEAHVVFGRRCNEGLFGELAEGATKVAGQFHPSDAVTTLRCLALFDLFDEELFTALANTVILAVGDPIGSPVTPEDVTGLVATFAHVNECRPKLFSVMAKFLDVYPTFTTCRGVLDALYAYHKNGKVNSPAVNGLLQQLNTFREEDRTSCGERYAEVREAYGGKVLPGVGPSPPHQQRAKSPKKETYLL